MPVTLVSRTDSSWPSGSALSNASPVGQTAANWAMVFEDDFPGSALDTTKWVSHLLEGDAFRCNDNASEVEWYPHSNAGMVVSNSNLVVSARKENPRNSASVGYDPLCPATLPSGQAPQYSSGMIQSHPSCQLTYGYVEARVKLSAPDGSNPANVADVWPAFWTYAADGDWPPELDVWEYGLDGLSTYRANVYNDSGLQLSNTNIAVDTGWHVYGCSYASGSVVCYKDGAAVATYSGTFSALPHHLVFNFAVQNGATFTRADVSVDYIRAWTKSGVPAAPKQPTVSRSGTSATVSFGAVSGATSYRVTVCPYDEQADGIGGARSSAATGSGSPITVGGLVSGARYTFTVAAISGTGYSAESPLSAVA